MPGQMMVGEEEVGMPTTRLGRWAGWLLVVSVVLLALVIVAYNTEALADLFQQGTVGGMSLWVAAAVSTVATVVTGAISWLRLRDHSPVVIVATVVGMLMTVVFVLGAMPG
jgi:hypothetical protein